MRSLRDKLALMAKLARRDSASPMAGAMARHAVSRVDRRAPLDANVLALCRWVRDWVRYTHEQPETISTLSALDSIPAGDCDDMCTALAALSWRIGYGWERQRFGIGWKGRHPTHVWLEVRGKNRRWIPLDASTWHLEPGQSPAATGRFTRSTYYILAELT